MSEMPGRSLIDDPDVQRLLEESSSDPVRSGTPIPEGHEGPYTPTIDEFLRGAQEASEATVAFDETRAQLVAESMRKAVKDA